MPINPGTRIGPYEVTGSLGAGGMGEVYRARDARLGRDVAIKVLPDLFSGDPDRLARFEREAHLLASLQHPRIAVVYGVEETRGQRALVMELVDGQTLADRLAAGPLPVDEAIGIARQIADALEAAHDKGIVHRDLKPANIKLRADGEIKVLDFGLAKSVGTVGGGSDLAHSPTVSIGTQAGLVLGTAAYMSPEQARGRPVDRRTDVWAFGCVLYEMLTGKAAFGGESVTDLIAAIVKEEPEWGRLPADVPPAVRRLLQRCLRKDARQRLRDMADVRLELDEAAIEPPPVVASVATARRTRVLIGTLAAAVLVLLALAGALVWRIMRPSPVAPAVTFSIDLPQPGDQLEPNMMAGALSPDGAKLVMTIIRNNERHLVVRPLDNIAATPLAGATHALNPFFSPDGRWIAFVSDQKLKKIPVDGGTALALTDAHWGGGTWGPDDTIIYTPHYTKGLWRVPAAGGSAVKLTEPDTSRGELGHWWPQFLPDGKHVLFTSFTTPIQRSRIVVYSLQTGTQEVVVEGAVFGRYVPSGHLVYLRAESLVAAPFDPDRRRVTGSAVALPEKAAVSLSNGLAQVMFAANGTLAFVPDLPGQSDTELVWLDQKGGISPAVPGPRRFDDLSLSPDGRRVALTIEDPTRDLWTYDFERGLFSRVTSGPSSNFNPIWSKDGRQIFYASERPVYNIYRKAPTGNAPEQPFVVSPYDTVPTGLTPDGGALVYAQDHPETRSDIWLQPLDGSGKPTPLLISKAEETHGCISPDGRWLAYDSDESGRRQVYVQSFPESAERVQVSVDGGEAPNWSSDGRTLYFVHDPQLMMAAVKPGPEFSTSKPTPMLDGRSPLLGYDIAPDGRVLILRRNPDAAPKRVQIVLNWFAELSKRVGQPVSR